MFRGKNYKESAKLIDRATLYEAKDAFELVTKASKAKFDETVELHVKLGVDGRHADQQVRGAIVLPNGTGKTVRVLVFCKDDKKEDALAAGADYAGGMDLVEKIQKERPSPCPRPSGPPGTPGSPWWSPPCPCGPCGWASASCWAGTWALACWASGWPCLRTGSCGSPFSFPGSWATSGRPWACGNKPIPPCRWQGGIFGPYAGISPWIRITRIKIGSTYWK